jgi:hypothetical protein
MKKLIIDALQTLNSVTSELINGVQEEDLIRRYRGQSIVPGVSIRQHLQELHAGGCLYYKEGKIFLKDSCNPLKLFQIF